MIIWVLDSWDSLHVYTRRIKQHTRIETLLTALGIVWYLAFFAEYNVFHSMNFISLRGLASLLYCAFKSKIFPGSLISYPSLFDFRSLASKKKTSKIKRGHSWLGRVSSACELHACTDLLLKEVVPILFPFFQSKTSWRVTNVCCNSLPTKLSTTSRA